MLADLRYALRLIGTHKWYSATVILILALGIAANTTVFTLVNAVLFKPVPVPNGERLLTVNGQNLSPSRNGGTGVSYPDFLTIRETQQSFETVEGMIGDRGVLSESDRSPERYTMARISPGLFGMLQTRPVLGRDFLASDGEPGAPVVVLISDRVWQNRYERDPGILGRSILLNGAPATIVGVMPPEFLFPQREDVWIPITPTPELEDRNRRPLQLFALLKPGVERETAASDLSVIARRIAADFPDSNKDYGLRARTFHETYNDGEIRVVFLTMLVAVGFVLLVACANVANLMLSRAVARERELTVRAALGASRGRLVRQLLTECIVLSTLGGLAGLGLAMAGVHLFDQTTQDVGRPYWIQFELDFSAFTYFAAISIASGLLFGLVPALRVSRVDVQAALKEGGRSAGSRRGGRLIGTLIAVQFAFTVILLTSAGLMVRTFFQAQTINPFVPVKQIFSAAVDLPAGTDERYAEPAARQRFYDELLARLAALPGVTHVAAASSLPGLGGSTRRLEFESDPLPDPARARSAAMVAHSPGYFDLINLRLLQGRGFRSDDGDPGKEVAVVTRDFADRQWPGQEAIGQRFRFIEGAQNQPGPWITVVGVSADMVQRQQDPYSLPLFFVPHRQVNFSAMNLAIRTSGEPSVAAAPLRQVLQEIDDQLPLSDARTMEESLERSRWFIVVFGSLFVAFASAALFMAAVGLYGVVAQATVQRTREIGIRMALGSTPFGVVRLILSRGLRQLCVGLAVGLAGAFGTSRFLDGFLIETSVHDPIVFSVVPLLLVVVGLLACWLPARRAALVNPTEALRAD